MAPLRSRTTSTRAGGYHPHLLHRLHLLADPKAEDVARPIEGRHLHYAGWVAGTMSFHGLDFEVVVDENGSPTNALKLTGGPGQVEFIIMIPEPPPEWPAAASMPHPR
jgi:hypothetical protein